MQLEQLLEKISSTTHPVVPFNPVNDKLLLLDFTAANTEISADALNDIDAFMHYINGKLEQAGATYGIGGYAEHRTVYGGSKVFDAKNGDEPRRFHLGIDVWGKPHTKVMAPLDGIVHSFAFNNGFGDYGATIILSHNVDGQAFHTLYGHLSMNSLKNLEEGQTIRKGDIFAEFGIPVENGHWPPHLHLQIIEDLEGWHGDYPGVCAFSDRDRYLANCPDPDLMMNMMQFAK